MGIDGIRWGNSSLGATFYIAAETADRAGGVGIELNCGHRSVKSVGSVIQEESELWDRVSVSIRIGKSS